MILSWKNNRVSSVASGRQGPARLARSASVSRSPRRARGNAGWVRPGYRRRAALRRRLVGGLLAVVLLLAAALFANSAALRANGAVVLARHEMPSVPVFFCQTDAAWADDLMGASDRTLAEAGDGLACLASLIEMQQLSTPIAGEVNPGTLNAWLSESGAYDANGSLDWQKVAKLLGASLVERQPGWGIGSTLEWLLQHEIYPVVRVKLSDTGAFHDVLVVGTVHGEFVIADPLDPSGIPNTLGIYDNRIYTVKYLK